MQSWLETVSEEDLRLDFEQLVPLGFDFLASDRKSGELRWRNSLPRGFAIELAVHPSSIRGEGFAFQSRLYLTSSRLLALERLASFKECLPDSPVYEAANPRGIMVSIYIEGLARVRQGGSINLTIWRVKQGIKEKDRWRTMVAEALDRFSETITDVRTLPRKLLELELLAAQGSPSPVALFGNAFVLAAEAAVLVGDRDAAAEYIRLGRDSSWKQAGGLNEGAVHIAACKARRLEMLRFEMPG